MAAEKLLLITDNKDTAYSYYKSIIGSETEIQTVYDISSDFVENADLLLIDTALTDMENDEICSKIQALKRIKSTSVIIVTNENDSDIINKFFSVGCDNVICKSADEREMSCRIRCCIDLEREMQKLISENNELNLFFAAIAHDLKSPVNSLIMLTDVLKDEIAELNEDTIKETTEILSNKSMKVSAMIDSLMSFSRISSMMPEVDEINIELLFEDIFNELHSLEPDRDITLKTESLPVIYGDDVLIEMLVKNLLSNAFKFTASRGKAVIEVKYKCDKQWDIISVKDNGIGFEMSGSEKIFRLFQRLHSTEEYDGNGVGLAMCRRIMTRLGGKIEANSSPDNGAEFILYFPKSNKH